MTLALSTPRLLLLPLSRALIERRLEADEFTLELPEMTVHVSPDWPGDLLGLLPMFLSQLGPALTAAVPDNYAAVRRTDGEVVGALGVKGAVKGGAAEIGYGFNPAVWGQGYATEAVAALCDQLLAQPGVQKVTAQTALSNRASERVLEKCGFVRVGHGSDAQHGDLTLWETEG